MIKIETWADMSARAHTWAPLEDAILDIAARLCIRRGRATVSSMEVQCALRILGLSRKYIAEGTRAVKEFFSDGAELRASPMYQRFKEELQEKIAGAFLIRGGMYAYMFGVKCAYADVGWCVDSADSSARELLRRTSHMVGYLRRRVIRIDDVMFALHWMCVGMPTCWLPLTEVEVRDVVEAAHPYAIVHKKFVREFNELGA